MSIFLLINKTKEGIAILCIYFAEVSPNYMNLLQTPFSFFSADSIMYPKHLTEQQVQRALN
jgi:hypothetical protein